MLHAALADIKLSLSCYEVLEALILKPPCPALPLVPLLEAILKKPFDDRLAQDQAVGLLALAGMAVTRGRATCRTEDFGLKPFLV